MVRDNVAFNQAEFDMLGRLLAADETPEVTSFEPPFLNSQSWRHIVAVDTVSSGQAPV